MQIDDVIAIVNEHISQLKELSSPTNYPIIDQTIEFVNDILTRDDNYNYGTKEFCEVCGKKLSKRSHEVHHVAGKKHSNICIDVCISCHRTITSRQSTWDGRWLLNNQPDNIREMFLLQGVREILILRGQKLHSDTIIEIADTMDYQVHSLRAL